MDKLGFLDEFISTAQKQIKALIEHEDKFLKKLKIDSKLFYQSALFDKGSNTKKVYTAWVPRTETLTKFGIKNITGHNDIVACNKELIGDQCWQEDK